MSIIRSVSLPVLFLKSLGDDIRHSLLINLDVQKGLINIM